jgi:DMSO/TMAO reductase YedYZ molybdopterin-dependent catalytic subunit
MSKKIERRDILKMGLAATSFLAVAVPEWAVPALAQGETVVPFTDIPATFNPGGEGTTRLYDIRNIDGLYTPGNEFFSIGHYGVPEVDAANYRLQVTGLVDQTAELSIDDIRSRPSVQVPAGYECSGNSARAMQGLSSCGSWTGTRLSDLLSELGTRSEAREVVFFGADRGEEADEFRGRPVELDSQFARSMSLENAMRPDPIIAYELNGQPLEARHGAPARLIMPGWYGVANVKWLTGIHVQQDRFVGHFQARWYRTVRGEEIGGDMKWNETEVTRMKIKSVIARVTRQGNTNRVMGFVLNDGTPLESVEVQIDGGAWQRATLDPANTEYSWKLFNFDWNGATAGEHTLVSRATDVNGVTQVTEAELETKQTFLEHNAQFPRTVMIS